jgi:acyl-CoA reductase-like NAD-dependent aldehyde dehydrogenase
MDAEIRPEPPAEEREAILRAAEDLLTRDPRPLAYRSAWREQGIRENADDGEVEEPV